MNTINLLINRISTCRERYKLKDKEAHRTYHSPVHSLMLINGAVILK